MEIYKGAVYGKPYSYVYVPPHMRLETLTWMRENFGESWSVVHPCNTTVPRLLDGIDSVDAIKPDQRWYAVQGYYWFRDDSDVTWFLLRWS